MVESLKKKLSSHFPLIVNLSHQKGGVGKSTLAYNITHAFCTLGLQIIPILRGLLKPLLQESFNFKL